MTTDPLVAALAAALPGAMRARDAAAVSAIRTALAAVANAEAVPVAGDASAAVATSAHVAGAAVGLGAAEAGRRLLSRAEVRGIVQREVTERLDAAAALAADPGSAEHVDRLRGEAAVLTGILDATAGSD
jgi:uncharacterized protein YqeY